MFNKKITVLAVLLTLVWAAGAYAEIKEGLWEITTKVEMKGVPMQMPATTVKQCITKDKAVPKSASEDYECKTKNYKVSGDTVTYSVECWGKGGLMITEGKTTYKGNTFDGTSTTKIKAKGQPEMQMSNKISGKYIGPCKK
ncbi:MAG: DUF3617 domain-containing protein [Syntrophaceae bacterium]|nr:DUF3617 domain-containing protein [Syntrophaceae bacterium]